MEVYIINNTIIAKIPKKVEGLIINPMIVSYDMVKDGVEIFVEDIVTKTNFKHIENLPEYAKRPYIMNHIMKNCLWIQYPLSLVSWYKEEEEIDSAKFYLSITEPKESEKEKDNQLYIIATTAISRGFSSELKNKAENCGVIEGYKKIEKLFKEKDNE